MLVTAGDAASHNTMTASWGGLGVLWGAPVATCYIRQSRYTKEFVDGSDLFTLSFLDPAVWRRQLSYLGRVSGRDEDKIKAAGLTPVAVDGTTILHMPLYRELLRRSRAGEFGRMNLAQLNFGSYKPYDPKVRFYNPELAGGAMLDIGVYALSLARLFMESQPAEVVSLANRCETGVDVTSGIVARNAEGQMAVLSLSLHSKQPKRAVLSFDRCYVEIMEYPRADRAVITWTEDGRREEVRAGEEAYALCYEMADLERATAGDAAAAGLIDTASDVMDLMTRLRREWGVTYPEEA